MKDIETELVAGMIDRSPHDRHLRPRRATWKDAVENLLAVAAIAALGYALYILAAIDFAANQ